MARSSLKEKGCVPVVKDLLVLENTYRNHTSNIVTILEQKQEFCLLFDSISSVRGMGLILSLRMRIEGHRL